MAVGESTNMRVFIALGILGLFAIITFALAAATLGTLNKQFNAVNRQLDVINEKLSMTTSTTTSPIITSDTTSQVSSTAEITNNASPRLKQQFQGHLYNDY